MLTKQEIKDKIVALNKARSRYAIACMFVIPIPFLVGQNKKHEVLKEEILSELKVYFKNVLDEHGFDRANRFNAEWLEELKNEEIAHHLSFYNIYALDKDCKIERLINEKIIINNIQNRINGRIEEDKRKAEREDKLMDFKILETIIREKYEKRKMLYTDNDYKTIVKRIDFLMENLEYMPSRLRYEGPISELIEKYEVSPFKDKFEYNPIFTIEEKKNKKPTNKECIKKIRQINHRYINHCWVCGSRIDEIEYYSMAYCPKCGHYKCRNCGACLCGRVKKSREF